MDTKQTLEGKTAFEQECSKHGAIPQNCTITKMQKRSFIAYVAEYRLDDASKGIALLSEDGDKFFVILNDIGKKTHGFEPTTLPTRRDTLPDCATPRRIR